MMQMTWIYNLKFTTRSLQSPLQPEVYDFIYNLKAYNLHLLFLFFDKMINFFSHKNAYVSENNEEFQKPFKMIVVQSFCNTSSKLESSTAMATHFRSSAKDPNLGAFCMVMAVNTTTRKIILG